MPETAWPRYLVEIRAAALYAENSRLAAGRVDCFAAHDGPSPLRGELGAPAYGAHR